jgi:hypothetical protein
MLVAVVAVNNSPHYARRLARADAELASTP